MVRLVSIDGSSRRDEARVSVYDRGFLYDCDRVFETIRTYRRVRAGTITWSAWTIGRLRVA
jgi:branched-subunit amino acid aminotransferase/4-amino-4-deoxychorismate lyase